MQQFSETFLFWEEWAFESSVRHRKRFERAPHSWWLMDSPTYAARTPFSFCVCMSVWKCPEAPTAGMGRGRQGERVSAPFWEQIFSGQWVTCCSLTSASSRLFTIDIYRDIPLMYFCSQNSSLKHAKMRLSYRFSRDSKENTQVMLFLAHQSMTVLLAIQACLTTDIRPKPVVITTMTNGKTCLARWWLTKQHFLARFLKIVASLLLTVLWLSGPVTATAA